MVIQDFQPRSNKTAKHDNSATVYRTDLAKVAKRPHQPDLLIFINRCDARNSCFAAAIYSLGK